MGVKIAKVKGGSIAQEIGLEPGDVIVRINNSEIFDILDYDFYQRDELLTLEIAPRDGGEPAVVEIEKDESEDLGVEFESYLIDKQHTCNNDCVFCFVNQMPGGMRDSLYFKDDDERLSFLFGNYITMTNMDKREVARIINMHISPIHVSVHATDPTVRGKMLKNRFAGQSLEYLKEFAEAGIHLHCQIVLCRGLNDGEVLKQTLRDLYALGDSLQSVAVVPVGLTKYRDNLFPLLPHDKETALAAIETVQHMQEIALRERGKRVFYPSDEFFLLAERELPDGAYYEEYAQLENGVGLLTLLKEEFSQALAQADFTPNEPRRVDMATGEAAFDTICALVAMAQQKYPELDVSVHKVKNNFFGGNVTVAGLITARDFVEQLQGKLHSREVLIPAVMLNYGKDRLLDDVRIEDLEEQLRVVITPVSNNGEELFYKIMGRSEHE